MATVVLVIHLMIAAAMIGVVLLQRSEGGGLGMGGGGGFMTGRGTANLLTRTTAVLAALFFVTSISLTLIANQAARPLSPLDINAPAGAPKTPASGPATAPAAPPPAAAPKAAEPAAPPAAPAVPQVPKSQ
jgi:preprotein translocase subunit SecG